MLRAPLKKSHYLSIVLFLLILISHPTHGFSPGLELQLYPAGQVFSLFHNWQLSEKEKVSLSLGFNLTDRKDYGEKDNEEGSGFGLGFGYQRSLEYFFSDDVQDFIGVRIENWRLKIDWQNYGGNAGTSTIYVVQPTAEYGIRFPLNSLILSTSLALGAEINLKTKGEKVGEGAIALIRLGIYFR